MKTSPACYARLGGFVRLACVSSVIAASAVLAAPGLALAGAAAQVVVYEKSSAAPPVGHVIGPVRASACHADEAGARTAALEQLRRHAAALGATGVVDVQLRVTKSQTLYIKNGFANPCRYGSSASGTAVVLGGDAVAQRSTPSTN